MNDKRDTRRDFVKRSAALVGGLVLSNQLSNARQPVGIRVVDQHITYVNKEYNTVFRPVPDDPGFRLHHGLPVLPAKLEVPFPWKEENLYGRSPGHCITDNVFLEPGKPWVLQLFISTPGIGDTQTGSPQYKVWYRTSTDNGKEFSPVRQVIIGGYTGNHPIDAVEIGRNGFNVDYGRPIVKASNGEIMVPIGLHPWDNEKKKIYLPVENAYGFQDAGVLIGSWMPDGSDVRWRFGNWLRIDHNLSTRGLSEPSIVELRTPGHFAMVARGSNLGRLELPCHTWLSFSRDYCRTWSAPRPLAYSDGSSFFVTTAQSALFTSTTTGKTYWIGNLNTKNPKASFPRYPLVIGEIDLDRFGVKRKTVSVIDTYQSGKDIETVQLSNFSIMEHKEKPEIIVLFTRRDRSGSAEKPSWFRIQLV